MNRLIGAIACVMVLVGTSSSHAQDLSGRLRLSAETDFFRYTSTSTSFSGGTSTGTSATSFGLLPNSFGAGVSYMVTDKILVGGRLDLARVSEEDASALRWGLAPIIEAIFGDGLVRPFVGGGLEIDGTGGDAVKQTNFGFFARGGIHLFPVDRFSIDLGAQVGWKTNIAGDRSDADIGVSQLNVGIYVGLSGWLGGKKTRSSSSAGSDGADNWAAAASEDTKVHTTLEFQGLTVDLVGDPIPGQKEIEVVARRTGRTSVLNSCDNIVFTIDGQRGVLYDLAHNTRDVANGLEESLAAKTTVDNVGFIARGVNVSLEVCGAAWTLVPNQIQQVKAFEDRFRGAATPDVWPPPAAPVAPAAPTTPVVVDPQPQPQPDAPQPGTQPADPW